MIFLATNLKKLRMQKSWSQDEVAKKLGVTRATIAQVESGKTKNPSLTDIIRLANLFDISVDSLLRTDLRKFTVSQLHELEIGNDGYAAGANLRIVVTTVDRENNENVELVPEIAKAGYRSGYADPKFISALPRYTLPGLSLNRKYRIFPIAGDSMLPYPDGCLIIGEYVENWPEIKDGTLCILILKNDSPDFIFKQVENRLKKNKKLIVKSLNPLYKPFEVPINDIIEVWKYKAHLAETITTQNPGVSMECLMRAIQEMKMDIADLIVDK